MAVKRLLAIVAAVAMVAGALVFRQFLDDGGDLSLGGSNAAIVCDRAIEDRCRSAFDNHDLTVEDPGVTYDRLTADDDPEPFVWIAGDLWFEMLADARDRGVLRWDVAEPDRIAQSPLVFAGDGTEDCSPTEWECLAVTDANLTIGISDPRRTSSGLAALAWLAYVRNGEQTSGLAWNGRNGADLTTLDVANLLNYRNARGRFDVSIVTFADFTELGPLGDQPLGPQVPTATVSIGALAIGNSKLPDVGDLRRELGDAGWTEPGSGDLGGPTGGNHISLRSEWS